jgi:predicted metalloprotease
MRWQGSRRSSNIEDRRGMGVSRGAGIGGAGLIIVLLVWLLGGNPAQVLQLLAGGSSDGGAATAPAPTGVPAADDQTGQFLSAILGMTEDVWGEIFRNAGQSYRAPTLVLFTDRVQSACGLSSSATGPFYCPGDEKLYLDTGFFDELARLGGPGDFAQAYVIGHEVGHHVQKLLGTEAEVRQLQAGARSQAEANQVQVAMELQADCYAGVWAHHANRRDRVLEPGDVEEGLRAAASIGDDRLQRGAGQVVSPESFTHGSAAQRQQWLRTGLERGDPNACDTFGR